MQLNSFSRLEVLIGIDNINKLKKSTVVVVGIGGVGGYVCEALARSAVGNLVLIDFDTVDVTNINRQIIATNKTIGRKKVDVMKERIMDINSECNVTVYDFFLSEETISKIDFTNVSFLVDCCDSMSTKKLLILEMLKRKIKFISSMGMANKMEPSKLEIISLDKTYNDPVARIMRKFVKDNEINNKIMVLSSSELPKKNGATLGSNAFVPSSAGLLLASYVIRQLIKYKK